MRHYDSLTKAQQRLYQDAVSRTHHREVELEVIRRRDGKRMFSLTNAFLGGSVQGDTSRDVPQRMECDVFDGEGRFDWSHNAHRKYMVQVIDSRFVRELDDWVAKEVITGPIWKFSQQYPVVRLEVYGSEWNAMGSAEAYHRVAATKATTVVRQLLRLAGAKNRDMGIPNLKATLPADVTVGVRAGKDRNRKKAGYQGPRRQVFRVTREDTYLGAADEVAESIDRELFTAGTGRFLLRRPVSKPQHRLTERHLVSPASEQPRGDDEQPNKWLVLGKDPEGPRDRVVGRASLPRRHDSSAWSQRWNDTPRRVVQVIDNPQVRSRKRANQIAERHRDRALRETTEYVVEALPVIPYMRPGTLVVVPTKAGNATTRVRSWSLPLGPGADPMTLGTTRRRGPR